MNIAEILEYCPKDTKLYSLVNGEVTLRRIEDPECLQYPIEVITNNHKSDFYTKDGLYTPFGECVLFPSIDQRDWNKFRIPVKKGDIMMKYDGSCPFIATGKLYSDISPKFICGINSLGKFEKSSGGDGWTTGFYIPASEEAKKELFDKMKEAGYRWNTDTLELEKIEPQFKEGDVVVDKDSNLCLVSKAEDFTTVIVSAVLYTDGTLRIYNSNNIYRLSKEITLASIKSRNKFYSTLVREGYIYDKEQHKFVRQEFKPFDKVLVKNNSEDPWIADIYLNYIEDTYNHYQCTAGRYRLCIPYESNEYLLWKTINMH